MLIIFTFLLLLKKKAKFFNPVNSFSSTSPNPSPPHFTQYLVTFQLKVGLFFNYAMSYASSFICLVLPPLFSVKMGLYKSKREVFFGSLMFVLGISVFLTMVYDNLMAASQILSFQIPTPVSECVSKYPINVFIAQYK